MRLSDLSNVEADFLTAAQIAPILKTNADTLRRQARQKPELLGFPVIVLGKRVLFPKKPFINFMEGRA